MPASGWVCRCRSGVGWVSVSRAWSPWWKATFATWEGGWIVSLGPACKPAFPLRQAIAHSTFRSYPLVTYAFVGYDSVGQELQSAERQMTMAITDLDVFAHLTDADIENLGTELDAIRQDIEDSRGERDAQYIHRTIAAQRALEIAGRVLLAVSSRRSAWWAG